MTGRIQKTYAMVLAFYIAIFTCIPLHAAGGTSFRLDMDSLNLKKGISTNITVSLINAQGAQITSIEGLENFDILSQGTRSSTSIVNSDVSYQEDLYYTVMPKAAGEFTLKAYILYNGQTYETNTLQVNVNEGSVNDNESFPDLFVKTTLSHSEAYLGEKIILTYELYSRYNIENYGFTEYIAIDGMITKDMPEDQLTAEYVYLDGNKYARFEVRQMIIDPIKSGTYTIPSFNLQANVITNSGSGGGFGFFFNSTEAMYLQTEEKELTVKPLPVEGKPNDFSGIVGDLRLDSNYSRVEMNYGDSFTLQATASGSCNLDSLKNIISEEIPGFTVYETQKNTIESVNNNQYYAQKAFEVILVPEKTGVLDFTPKSISYFNPVTEKYENAEISAVTVEVLGDMLQSNNNFGNVSTVETVVIDQVNYAASNTNDNYFSIQIRKDTVYIILIGFIGFAAVAGIVILLVSTMKKRDTALKSFYKKIMSAKDINEIYIQLNAMIKHCYNVSIKASSQNAVRSILPDSVLAAQVTDIMDYMESAKPGDEKAYNYLKDKVKGIYRMMKCENLKKRAVIND